MAGQGKRRKGSQQEFRQTNIQDMPEVILLYIISMLPLQDQVKTAVLCRRWRNLWISNQTWDLEYDSFPEMQRRQRTFELLVDRIIYHHKGHGIHSMRIKYDYNRMHYNRAANWIDHLVRNNIRRLDIDLYEPIVPPLSLFVCETLVELRIALFNQYLDLSGNVFLPHLKGLHLEKLKFNLAEWFQKLVHGCPVLQILNVRKCIFDVPTVKEIRLVVPTMKSLTFHECFGFQLFTFYWSAEKATEFRYRGRGLITREGCLNLPSIGTVTLELERERPTVDYTMTRTEPNIEIQPELLCRVLRHIPNAKDLRLNEWCVQYLSTIKGCWPLMPPDKLENLDVTIWANNDHCYAVARLISYFLNLEMLQLSVTGPNETLEAALRNYRINYPRGPKFLSAEMPHFKLRRVEIKNFACIEQQITMIKFFLKNCVSLEKLIVECANEVSYRRYATRIHGYPRASAVVEIKFL